MVEGSSPPFGVFLPDATFDGGGSAQIVCTAAGISKEQNSRWHVNGAIPSRHSQNK